MRIVSRRVSGSAARFFRRVSASGAAPRPAGRSTRDPGRPHRELRRVGQADQFGSVSAFSLVDTFAAPAPA